MLSPTAAPLSPGAVGGPAEVGGGGRSPPSSMAGSPPPPRFPAPNSHSHSEDSASLAAAAATRPALSAPHGLSLEEEDAASLAAAATRPALYPRSHRPRARLDPLTRHTVDDVLDALKLSPVEGLFNLAFIILAFQILADAASSVRDRGLLLDPLNDILLPALDPDTLAPTVGLLAGVWLSTLLHFLVVRAWVRHLLSWRTLVLVSAAAQLLIVGGCVAAVLHGPFSPLRSALCLISSLIAALKCHSYTMTNYAVGVEQDGAEEGDDGDNEARARGSPASSCPPSLSPVFAPTAAGEATASGVETRAAAFLPKGPSDTHPAGGLRRRTGAAASPPPAAARQRSSGAAQVVVAPSSSSSSSSSSAEEALLSTRPARPRLPRSWPQSLTLTDFVYFLAAPTLVYEPSFPRTKAVRWRYVGRKLLEAAVCLAVQYAVFRQLMLPVLLDTPPAHADAKGAGAAHHTARSSPAAPTSLASASAVWLVRLARLAVPSMLVWLTGFYAVFHALLNAVAEALRFADREFSGSWWNATALDSFWREWDRPVHEWALRHIVVESMHYSGVSKATAFLGTFVLSALLHELVVSVAFRTARPWFFAGMVAQVPLAYVGAAFRGTRRGNALVWLSLFIGHPLLELLYARAYIEAGEG
jgi:hypothetical protein